MPSMAQITQLDGEEMGPAEFTGNRKILILFTWKPTNDICIKTRLIQNGKQ